MLKSTKIKILVTACVIGGAFVVWNFTGVGQSSEKRAERLFKKAESTFRKDNAEQKTIATLEKALALNPYHEEAHLMLGVIYELGQYRDNRKAEEQYRLALKTNPNNVRANFFIGRLYSSIGAYKEAIPFLEKATKSDQKTHAHFLLGQIHIEAKKWMEAKREINLGIHKFPDDGWGYALLGKLLVWEGNDAEAILNFEKALRIEIGLYGHVIEAGSIYEERGQYEKAIALYKRALKIVRTNPLEDALKNAEAKLPK